jgi:hypothetical protein
MSAAAKPRSPVYRQLEAYEESWKPDHAEAMDCRDWEDAIAVGLGVYRMVWERQDTWRDQIFRGVIPYAEEDNREHQARLANWLATTREVLSAILPGLEARFGRVEGAAELRRCAEAVEAVLSAWEPPRLSMAVGLREQTLSPEAAAEFKRIVYEQPPPLREDSHHPPMREMPAEEFRRLFPKRQT